MPLTSNTTQRTEIVLNSDSGIKHPPTFTHSHQNMNENLECTEFSKKIMAIAAANNDTADDEKEVLAMFKELLALIRGNLVEKQKLTKKYFLNLPTGCYIASNCFQVEKSDRHTPIFHDYVVPPNRARGPMETNQGGWCKSKDVHYSLKPGRM